MKLLALTKYSYEGPSSRYRFYNYQKCFQENGISMTIKPLFSKRYFQSSNKLQKSIVVLCSYVKRFSEVLKLLVLKKYDLVLIEYELFPYMPSWFEYLLKRRGIKYIVDYDDAIFHKYDLSKNILIKLLLKKKIASVICNAYKVIVCNNYLKNYALQYHEKIITLPTVVPLDKYILEQEAYKTEQQKFTIGWIGSRTTSPYILEILPVFESFIENKSDVQFNLIGFDHLLLSDEEIEKYHLNIIKWSEKNEIKDMLAFDVGIMPLHDDPWSRGKCGFKLIQYMSCKKPVIASPVGVNVDIVEEGVNGFLVENKAQWLRAFEKLYQSKKLREKIGYNNFHKVVKKFNNKKNCQKYSKIINEVF